MKKYSNILWGIVLTTFGVIFALGALNIVNVNIFFDGWWTLFIIIPCTIGLFTDHDKIGNLIGIAIGVFLLLSSQDVIEFGVIWKLLVPAIIIIIGLKLIFGGIFDKKTAEITAKMKQNGAEFKSGFAAFSGQNMVFAGEKFEGAQLNAIFGGVKCDLRGAIIDSDCIINATAIFGGIDIIVPDYVNIKVNSTSLFGGISNKKHTNSTANTVTLFVNGTCMFGGVDIK